MKILGILFLLISVGTVIFGVSLGTPSNEEQSQWRKYSDMKNERDAAVQHYTNIDPQIIYQPRIAAELAKADQFIADEENKYEKLRADRQQSQKSALVIAGIMTVIGSIVVVVGFSGTQKTLVSNPQ